MHTAVRAVRARPRMILSACLALVLPFLLPQDWRMVTRVLIGWDIGIIVYLACAWTMVAGANTQRMRQHATLQDDGAVAVLTLTSIAALASIVAIAAELASVKDVSDSLKGLHIALAGVTLLGSWFLVHTIFALHYAYEFYVEEARKMPAFDFPGHTKEPAFSDFFYVSFTIGASSAISDVNVTSARVRKVIMAHSVLSFFFNTSVLGFAINVGAGLLG